MSLIAQAFGYLFAGANWTGDGGFLQQIGDHLVLTGLALLVAALVAVPLGLAIGHDRSSERGAWLRGTVVPVANALRALPTLGLLSLLVVGTNLGIWAVVVVLALLAVPPLLAGVYSGLESVGPHVRDAARAQGMTGVQLLFQVELPLGAPLIVGGLRSALVQIFATATLAFSFGFESLGDAILSGLATANYAQMIAGAILVTVGALVLDALLAIVQRIVRPRGTSRGSTGGVTTARGRRTMAPAATGPRSAVPAVTKGDTAP